MVTSYKQNDHKLTQNLFYGKIRHLEVGNKLKSSSQTLTVINTNCLRAACLLLSTMKRNDNNADDNEGEL